MSTNTLANIAAAIVRFTHINDIRSALRGDFVGRNSSGAAASGQNLGNATYSWGNAYITDLIYNGVPVGSDVFASPSNRIISGAVRATSNQPDFLRAAGSSASFTLLASSTPFKFVVNNEIVTVSSDIVVTGLTTAPSSGNTCTLTDTDLNDQYATNFLGERDARSLISIGGPTGSEITDREGFLGTFQTANSEYLIARIQSGYISDGFRGYYLNSSGTPVERNTLAFSDTLTILETGWIFIQNNGTTIDVSYVTPIVSATEPTLGLDGNALTDGQYWFDLVNSIWKRYSTTSSSFENLNRMLIGLCVMNTTNCIATRSFDFYKDFNDFNSISLQRISDSLIQSDSINNSVSVYGNTVNFDNALFSFDTSTDMETGVSLTADTQYYLYITDTGVSKISDIRHYKRPDLRGYYHPYNNWRAVGEFYYTAASAIIYVKSYRDLIDSYVISGVTADKYSEITSPIKTRKYYIPIRSWDMDAAGTYYIYMKGFSAFASAYTLKIVDVEAWIIPDTGAIYEKFSNAGTIQVNSGYIIYLNRTAAGIFDSVNFDDTTIDRGYCMVEVEI